MICKWVHRYIYFLRKLCRFWSKVIICNNLFVTSIKRNHKFTNLKCCKKAGDPFETIFIYHFKKHFQSCLFFWKALKNILKQFKCIGKFLYKQIQSRERIWKLYILGKTTFFEGSQHFCKICSVQLLFVVASVTVMFLWNSKS